MLASTGGVAFFLDGAIQLVLTSWTITFSVADVAESDASIVRTSKLVFTAVISWAVLFVLAVWTIRFAVAHLESHHFTFHIPIIRL